jgi:protein ImuB
MLTAAAIAERVRWQLDGWLTGARRGAPHRPTAGLVRLRLVPDGVLVHLGLQPGLWGDTGAERERAHRALSRIQGLLGPEAVLTAVLGGGRSADDQVRLVPWGDERTSARPTGEPVTPLPALAPVVVTLTDPPVPEILPAAPGEAAPLSLPAAPGEAAPRLLPAAPGEAAPRLLPAAPGEAAPAGTGKGRKGSKRPVPLPPWPGRLPRPAPALVLPQALPAVVLDADRRPVGVSARLELTGDPAFLLIGAAGPVVIAGWAGPWPVDERWWAATEARRRARFQVVLDDGRALLLSLVSGHWAIEAIYD